MTNDAAAQAFYSALQSKAMQAVENTFRSELLPVQQPAQGDFAWYWTNQNNDLNNATYEYIDARVSPGTVPGTVALSAGGGFANAYVQILNNIEFSLSQADQQKLNQAQLNASTQGMTIVTNYQNIVGVITPQQLAAAGVGTKLDYVISYALGSLWSGQNPPLSYTAMTQSRNLRSLLPKAPASADQVISSVTIYLNIMQPVTALSDSLQNGQWMLNQLKGNAMNPTANNGGITTFDPNTGASATTLSAGWTINDSVQSISNALQNTSNEISMSVSTSQASQDALDVQVDGQAGFTVGSWLSFDTEASGSYDMSRAAGTSAETTVDISYQGYTLVSAAPRPWQQDTNVGFYWSDPISQAVKNGTQDVTGFRFATTGQQPYDLAAGGNFGLLTNVLIANYPTVTIKYHNADFSAFQQAWSEKVSGNLTLFGAIKLGSISQGAYGSTLQSSSNNSEFSVTFSASPQVIAVPQALQKAFVVAAAVTYPGAAQ